MGYVILIRKVVDNASVHYYSVFKDNNLNEVNYYIGIDSEQKKIYFFEDRSFGDSFAVYNLKIDGFEKLDSNLKSLINGKVIMKALRAIHNNEFPNSISWES